MKPAWLEFGFEPEAKGKTLGWFRQVHGKKVITLPGQATLPLPEADAGITWEAGKTASVFTADCLPVLLYTDAAGPIGAIHAGWRGALAGVVKATLQEMGVPLSQTYAILGPSIGPCCFEIKQDFIESFEFCGRPILPYLQKREGKIFCDLVEFVLREELSLPIAHVDRTFHRCTVCTTPLLPSYRRNKNTDFLIRSWVRKTSYAG
jgi:YfiH family protein